MRSLLFVPADSERKLARASTIEADAIVYDLEDSVLPDRKVVARQLLTAHLKSANHPRTELGYVLTDRSRANC